jgi:hypothetical protein
VPLRGMLLSFRSNAVQHGLSTAAGGVHFLRCAFGISFACRWRTPFPSPRSFAMNRPALTATALLLSLLTGHAVAQDPGETNSQPTSTPRITSVAHVTEVPVEKEAPPLEGHPLTSVVVTQCNLIVAVYMTMPDGRLLRFDKSTAVPSEQLMTMAYSATRSERVEVSCNEAGAAGYEKHEPV